MLARRRTWRTIVAAAASAGIVGGIVALPQTAYAALSAQAQPLPHAASTFDAWWWLLVLGVVVAILVALVVIVAVRRRARRHEDAEHEADWATV